MLYMLYMPWEPLFSVHCVCVRHCIEYILLLLGSAQRPAAQTICCPPPAAVSTGAAVQHRPDQVPDAAAAGGHCLPAPQVGDPQGPQDIKPAVQQHRGAQDLRLWPGTPVWGPPQPLHTHGETAPFWRAMWTQCWYKEGHGFGGWGWEFEQGQLGQLLHNSCGVAYQLWWVLHLLDAILRALLLHSAPRACGSGCWCVLS